MLVEMKYSLYYCRLKILKRHKNDKLANVTAAVAGYMRSYDIILYDLLCYQEKDNKIRQRLKQLNPD